MLPKVVVLVAGDGKGLVSVAIAVYDLAVGSDMEIVDDARTFAFRTGAFAQSRHDVLGGDPFDSLSHGVCLLLFLWVAFCFSPLPVP